MAIFEALLVLIAACTGFALLARRLRLPYAVILVLGGMALAFVPAAPHVVLDPQIALAFFLPPLLQASAWRTDWRAFRGNLRPILLLAVGAVAFTAACIAAAAKWLIPEMPLGAAVALGAIVAPPDAVAAGAVLERLRLPPRIVTVLEGESLINDASALVLYRFAIAATLGGAAAGSVAYGSGAGLTLGQATASFVLVTAGGIATGYAVGRATLWAMVRLGDPLLEIIASFLSCFVAFLAAEALHSSGVIAVVTAGLVLGRAQHAALSSRTRLEARAVWDFAEFVLTSLVFILIGLQLNAILGRLDGRGPWQLAGTVAALSLVLIVSRFLWLVPAVWLPRRIPSIRRHDPMPPWSWVAVIGWAGMRGVVSLAAALALPIGFPERDLIVFLAFCAILATLVLQGTTLEWLIRRLGVEEGPERAEPGGGGGGLHPQEAEARRLVATAMLGALEDRAADLLEGAIARDLLPEYRDNARVLHGLGSGATAAELSARLRLRLAALRAGRARLLAHHGGSGMREELLVRLEHELDLEELRLRRLLGAQKPAA